MGTCKHCQQPTFKGADNKLRHERRERPDERGGRRVGPSSSPAAGAGAGAQGSGTGDPPPQEREPDRSHVLHRRLFGKKDEQQK